MKMLNITNATHYQWGENCDSWNLVDTTGLSVKLEKMPPTTREKLHFHEKAQQFFFVLNGKATFYIDGKRQEINEKEGVLITSNTTHYIANESNAELEFLVISQPSTQDDRFEIKNEN